MPRTLTNTLLGCVSWRVMEKRALLLAAAGAGLLGIAPASCEDVDTLRPPYYIKWRKNPKVCRAAKSSRHLEVEVDHTHILYQVYIYGGIHTTIITTVPGSCFVAVLMLP